MANPIFERRKFQKELEKVSRQLAEANGLLGTDSFLRDTQDQPLRFGVASTNAIAHALTSAHLAYDYPAVAAFLGSAREHRSYWFDPKRPPAWDTFKDLYNNQVGRNIAEYAKRNNLSRDQMQDLVLDALSSGKLIVTQNDPRIDPSFGGNPLSYSGPRGADAPWTAPSVGFPEFAPVSRESRWRRQTGKANARYRLLPERWVGFKGNRQPVARSIQYLREAGLRHHLSISKALRLQTNRRRSTAASMV